ncbi:hypothetical protein [Pseudomonas sp. Irchel 3E20]|uniref:hypothetical protein n=1 Tax=Pseudomonas sp. Irchel 3E20 TaxID=2008983 RepID=UPI000BA44761|nr:hypothetical protein [Pseudomonas sp. Irchel 3E20]
MNSRVLEFALGEKGDTIIQRASSSIQRSGVSSALFYTARNMQYRLKHPKHGLTFPLASTVLFYDDASDTYGVDEVNMRLDLPKRPILKKISDAELEIYDRQLYELVMALQASIQAVGWKRFIMLSDPRLTGRTTYHFKEGHLNQPSVASLKLVSPFLADPDYRLSWEDWKSLKNGFIWYWQADGMLLKVRYSPGIRTENSDTPLFDNLNVILQTTNSLSGASHPNEATRAKYATTLAGALLLRIKAEEQARALGLPILESYQDPTMVTGVPVPSMESVAKAEALKQAQTAPPEPVLRKAAGELCPQSGWWFTPAQVNSRRYFQQGTPFPAIGDSNFGTTFWQWSPDQSNPTL